MKKLFKNRMFKVLLVTTAVTVFISSADSSLRTLGSSVAAMKSKSAEVLLNEEEVEEVQEDVTSNDSVTEEETVDSSNEVQEESNGEEETESVEASEETEESSETQQSEEQDISGETEENEAETDNNEETEDNGEETDDNGETEDKDEETDDNGETEDKDEETDDNDETEDNGEETDDNEETEDNGEETDEIGETETNSENDLNKSMLPAELNFDGLNISKETKNALENGAILINLSEEIATDGYGYLHERAPSGQSDYLTLNEPNVSYVITGSFDTAINGIFREYRIVLVDNGNFDIIMDNANLLAEHSESAGISIGNNSTVNLKIVGTNTVTADQFTSNKAAISVPETSTLRIDGTGTLTAIGGDRSLEEYYYLNNFSEGGAGIGSNANENSGTIIINSGTIIAEGGGLRLSGAGIGSGYGGNSGPITINGGTIKATGGGYTEKEVYKRYGDEEAGAGIGAGGSGSTAPIVINNGTITATGGGGIYGGAGIGGSGKGKDNHNITINGGTIKATGGGVNYKSDFGGAGIGSGGTGMFHNKDVSSSSITIKGGTITATGGAINNNRTQYGGAGIGGGAFRGGNNININNTLDAVNIVAIGGGNTDKNGFAFSFGGAGIGGGYGSGANVETKNIRIIGSSPDSLKVEAYGGGLGPSGSTRVSGGAAIGAGATGSVENITIIGANVKAYGTGYGSAGIGGSNNGSGANNIVIGEKDNDSIRTIIDAKGAMGGAGIGSGLSFKGLDGIYIYGANTDVTADGNASTHSGAGIGGGAKASAGAVANNINIYNGTVKAYGSLLGDNGENSSAIGGGAGIGSGAQSPVSNINIYNGKITAIGGGTSNAGNIATGGAGIGSGVSSVATSINIYGGTIEAVGGGTSNAHDGYGGAGIGGGYNSTAYDINIQGGIITATGGGISENRRAYGGAGVGAGYYKEGYNITIDNATLTATGGGVSGISVGAGGAGIGDGARLLEENRTNNSNIVITDTAKVKAYAKDNYAIGRNDSIIQLNNNIINAYVAEPLATIDLSITPVGIDSKARTQDNLILPANYTAFAYTADNNNNYEHRYSMNGELITLYVVEDRIDDFVVVNTSEVKVADTYRATELITRKFYNVTFDEDGGSYKPEVQKVMEYKKAEMPENPTKAGFRFLGWFDVDGNLFDFDTTIVTDVLLKAKWDEVVLDVSAPPTINRTFVGDKVITGRGIAGSQVTLGIIINSLGTTTTLSAITVKSDNTWSVTVPSDITLSEKDKLNAVQLEVGKSISTAFSRGVIATISIEVPVIEKEPKDEDDTGNPFIVDGGDEPGDALVPGTGTINVGNNEVVEEFLAEINEEDETVFIYDEDGTPLGTVSLDDYVEGNFDNFIPLGSNEEIEEVVEVAPTTVKANPKTGGTQTVPMASMLAIIFGALAVIINKRKNFIN